MPNPKIYKDKKHWMKDCLHQTMHMEKKDKEHALAQCLNQWRKHHPSKKDKWPKKKSACNVVTAYLNRIRKDI